MANSALIVANVEFDDIRTAIREYLSSQAVFQDYNFEGSNLSVLLDVLAYNTYMQNFYLNQVASESFLDSAQLRDSVISHAKSLNYLPRSYSASKAIVDVEIFPSDSPSSIVIPKYTTFTTLVDGQTYNFLTSEARVITTTDGRYVANNVELFEGELISELFQANTADETQRFVISNDQIDVDRLSVYVRASNTDTTNTEFTRASSIFGLDPSSNVYFIMPAENGKYELQFGDGNVGTAILNGQVIEAVYQISSGEEPNEATSFSLSGTISGYSNVAITTVQRALGGAEAESIADIKFYAPKNISIQERAVTSNDYETLLRQEFPDIEAISVYGGQEASPPRYGRVIISVDLQNADGIPNTRKEQIIQFLDDKAPTSIRIEVIDPIFTFVNITSEVNFDINSTTKSASDIVALATTAATNFASANINDFNSTFRYSKFLQAINEADGSILSNETSVTLSQLWNPTTGTPQNVNLFFQNPVAADRPGSTRDTTVEPGVSSSTFTYEGTTDAELRSDGFGNIDVVVVDDDGTYSIIENGVGTVDYDTGEITITGLTIDSFVGAGIRITIKPRNQDVSSTTNTILSLDEDFLTITATEERI